MGLNYVKAKKEDADLLIELYNASFYEDYMRYGECPAYGRSRDSMEESIEKFPKHIIYCEDKPIGAFSVVAQGNGEYYLGCLCIVSEYQGKGIGTQAMGFILDYYEDWQKITLITPADKEENIAFYTKKCGFRIDSTEMDGNVRVAHFVLDR